MASYISPVRTSRFASIITTAASALIVLTSVTATPVDARVEPEPPNVVVAGDIQNRNHEIAHNPERNEYFAVWEDFGTVAGEIYGQRLAADGTPLDAPIKIAAQGHNDDGNLLQQTFMPPKVAYNAATNQYLVVFGRDASGADDIEDRRFAVVLGRLVSDMGALVGGEVPLNPPLGTAQTGLAGACYPRSPDVVADPNTGGYVLAYTKIFYGNPVRGTCDGLENEVTTTVQALSGSLGRGTRVDVLTNSEEGTPIPALGHNPVTNQIMVTRSFTELRAGANRDGRRFEAQILTSALTPVGSILTVDVDPVDPIYSGPVMRAIPVGDPATGNWFVASTTRFAGTIWTNLLDRNGASLRTGTRSDSGVMQSVDAVGDGTFVFSTNRGDIFHVRADGSEIHQTAPFSGQIYETPSVAIGADGTGVAVGAKGADTVAVGFSVVAPGVLTLPPARLLETRSGSGVSTVDGEALGDGPVPGGEVKVLQVAGRGGVPTDAEAVNLNVSAAQASGVGFVTVYPCDADQPTASNLNYTSSGAASAAAFATLSAAGTVCLFTSASAHLIVDVNGFVPDDGSVSPLVPARLLDSRPTGETIDGVSQRLGRVGANSTTTLKVTGRGGVAPDADAVVVNATAIKPSTGAFLTVYPCDQDQPSASSLNAAAGSIVNNLVVAKVSAAGTICVFSSAATDLVVDVAAFVPAGGGLLSIVPARLLETRAGLDTVDGQSATTSPVGAMSRTSLRVAGRGGVSEDATGAVLNVAAIRPDTGGFITAYPCDEDRPEASNVNFPAGSIVSNAVVVKLSASGDVCLYSTSGTNLAVDVVGYTVDA